MLRRAQKEANLTGNLPQEAILKFNPMLKLPLSVNNSFLNIAKKKSKVRRSKRPWSMTSIILAEALPMLTFN